MCFYCFLIGGCVPHLPKSVLIFRDVITVRVLRSLLLRSDVTLPSVDFRVVPCLSVVPMLTTGDIVTGTVRRGRAQGGFVALRGLAISCVSRLRCRLPLLWLAAGRISLTHCGLWRSRLRWAHSVVFVVVAAHSRQCSVICCMHSAGNVTSPLCCTCELIRDAHCRAVAWPDGGRRT